MYRMNRGFTHIAYGTINPDGSILNRPWDLNMDDQFARLRAICNWVRPGYLQYSFDANSDNPTPTPVAGSANLLMTQAALAGGYWKPNHYPPFEVVQTGVASTQVHLSQKTFQLYRTQTLEFASRLNQFIQENDIPPERLIFAGGGNEEDRDPLYSVSSIVYNGDGTATATTTLKTRFEVGDRLYVFGVSNSTQYNTPAWVSESNRGGGLITAVSADGLGVTYQTNGVPSNPTASGGFIKIANIGQRELQYKLIALNEEVKALPGWQSKTCLCFNDTYINDYTTEPILSAALASYDFVFLNQYGSRAVFEANIQRMADVYGLRSGITEWDTNNGFNDFGNETRWGQELAWREKIVSEHIMNGTLKYDFNYAYTDGQDIWAKFRKNSLTRESLDYILGTKKKKTVPPSNQLFGWVYGEGKSFDTEVWKSRIGAKVHYGKGAQFSQPDSVIKFTPNSVFNGANLPKFSVAYTFAADSLEDAGNRLIDVSTGLPGSGFTIFCQKGSGLIASVAHTNVSASCSTGGGVIISRPNKFYRILMTWNDAGTFPRLYVNGINYTYNVTQKSGTRSFVSGGWFTLGNGNGIVRNLQHIGTHLKIWNEELDQSDAIADFKGDNVKPGNVIMNWEMQEDAGTGMVYDSGPNGFHGTCTNIIQGVEVHYTG